MNTQPSPKTKKCPDCNGEKMVRYITASTTWIKCPTCKGTGLAPEPVSDPSFERKVMPNGDAQMPAANDSPKFNPTGKPVSEKTLKWKSTDFQHRSEALNFEYTVQWEDSGDQRHVHAYLIKPHLTSTLSATFGSYPTIERAKQVCQIHADAAESTASHARKEAFSEFLTSELAKGTV